MSTAVDRTTSGRSNRRLGALVNGVAVAVFIQWIGAGAVLPTLPVFLEQRDASPALVGIAMSAFFVAGVLLQYPIGRLVDRIGERPLLVGGLVLYAFASVAFLAPVSPWAAVAVRFVQGTGAGAVTVAALAAVGRYVPADRKGTGFARVSAAEIGGLGVGPLLGALAGTEHLGVLFAVSAVASVIAAVVVFIVVRAEHAPTSEPGAQELTPEDLVDVEPLLHGPRRRLLAGLVLAAAIVGLTAGVYETCWTLLLQDRGASTWAIGLSWTLFCVPYVVITPLAGRIVDRFDRQRLTVVSLLGTVVLIGVYPFIGSLAVIIGLGVLEAVGTAVAVPAAQALLASGVPRRMIGRAQGLFSASQTGATAVAAAVGGALFGLGPRVPFVAAGAVSIVLLASVPIMWRKAG